MSLDHATIAALPTFEERALAFIDQSQGRLALVMAMLDARLAETTADPDQQPPDAEPAMPACIQAETQLAARHANTTAMTMTPHAKQQPTADATAPHANNAAMTTTPRAKQQATPNAADPHTKTTAMTMTPHAKQPATADAAARPADNVVMTTTPHAMQPATASAAVRPAHPTPITTTPHAKQRLRSEAAAPQVVNRGRLRSGGPGGDPSTAPRCGARTRACGACRQPAMPNGRCRLHGGQSTGARIKAGLDRIRAAATRHGVWSAEGRAFDRTVRDLLSAGDKPFASLIRPPASEHTARRARPGRLATPPNHATPSP